MDGQSPLMGEFLVAVILNAAKDRLGE